MSRRAVRVLGLFPGLATTEIGGVQASGRAAWRAILGTGSGKGTVPSADMWHACWGPGWKGIVDSDSHGVGAHSRLSVLTGAARCRWSVGTILVWHLDLLRLVPLFRASGARVVLFLHGIEAWRRRDWLTRRLLHGVELFLSNSEHTWQRFVACNRDLQAAAHRVVPLGIGSTEGGAAEPPAPASTPAALMLGRLLRAEDYKGHREMIAAWPLVLRRMPAAELWIAGDGDLRPELEHLAADLGLRGRVRFWGQVSEEQKQRLLAQSRCLVLPSRGEGFGLVYAEAMRVGRPCLVSTVDGGREVVNPPEAGLAAPPDSPEGLADAACDLMTPGPEWDGWSTRARLRYERRFTVDHFAWRLLAALNGVTEAAKVA